MRLPPSRAAPFPYTTLFRSRGLAHVPVRVHTPVAETAGVRLVTPPLLVPVLRAGLGMVDVAHALIPEAQVGFVGVSATNTPTPRCPTWRRCRTTWPASRKIGRAHV